METKDALEIYKEARKEACKMGIISVIVMFLSMLMICLLFGFFIYKSYDVAPTATTITQTQDGTNNNQERINEADTNN